MPPAPTGLALGPLAFLPGSVQLVAAAAALSLALLPTPWASRWPGRDPLGPGLLALSPAHLWGCSQSTAVRRVLQMVLSLVYVLPSR